METQANISTLVLDAGPLITRGVSSLTPLAEKFFTTPLVYNEIRDEQARQNLALWGELLEVRQPQPKYVQIVSDFAKKTGDYSVLSVSDLHILALTYELEVELNDGDWRLRKAPGQATINGPSPAKAATQAASAAEESETDSAEGPTASTEAAAPSRLEAEAPVQTEQDDLVTQAENLSLNAGDDGWATVPAKKKTGKQNTGPSRSALKRQRIQAEKEAAAAAAAAATAAAAAEAAAAEAAAEAEAQAEAQAEADTEAAEGNAAFDDEDEDGGEWITPETLREYQILDGTLIDGTKKNGISEQATHMKVGMASGDFAMQNVAMQIGLNVINAVSGLRIRKTRSWMLRCHACFKLCQPSTTSTPRQFCPSCGGATLLRCTVTTSADTGKLQVHLKKNMQWSHRGDRYSVQNPQSKANRRRGVASDSSETLLREDQKEYLKAVKDDAWQKRHNEKLFDEWVGGSADTMASPFASGGYKRDNVRPGVRVGRGKYVNERRRK
ncbi:Nin one binding Zn-ribbon like-domain-containing protein [Dipodascopsis tothii]|uniref:Nin one binding Zn-ribbon like-domain-containing protein n=1 Tax=Dipodascopsis tothii TaxID=44089 RepID=UPI0034CF4827